MFTATSPDEMPDLETTLSMSGLEFMQAMRDGRISRPPIAALMNYTIEDIDEGKTIFRGTPEFQHSNPAGGVHGGWYGTLLDTCMSCAVMTVTPKGSVYTTLEYKVNMVGAIPIGREIRAIGTITHAGRTTGVAQGEIRDVASHKLYATGSATCLIMKLRGD
ncbi:uncharacterized protein (TIGR00369 family) [Yoonia maricola]|uniref:Uncharacterized protein (TIGR00369 family) n=1 Tax=Yoonia maricola TaxID=420999 RepID=A0A2M8WP62_9RHOB|nr:PaaI family thioesterase [Yoonia maricola]PJI92698.1 uncharacterized protein (TIGR00369 family) [Yoonia maricola]